MTDEPGSRRPARARVIVFGNLAMNCERDVDVHTIRLLGELHAANAGRLQLELRRIQTGEAAARGPAAFS